MYRRLARVGQYGRHLYNAAATRTERQKRPQNGHAIGFFAHGAVITYGGSRGEIPFCFFKEKNKLNLRVNIGAICVRCGLCFLFYSLSARDWSEGSQKEGSIHVIGQCAKGLSQARGRLRNTARSGRREQAVGYQKKNNNKNQGHFSLRAAVQ